MPTELTVLAWSTVLLLAHVLIQAQASTRDRGLTWNAGARDGEAAPLGPLAARAQRALDNFQQTYPAFVALALALAITGQGGGAGATVWFVARVVYLPLYLLGVPWLRSLAWAASVIGLGMMLVRLL
jgi:uncharacterized MAPEG superfamily protein